MKPLARGADSSQEKHVAPDFGYYSEMSSLKPREGTALDYGYSQLKCLHDYTQIIKYKTLAGGIQKEWGGKPPIIGGD